MKNENRSGYKKTSVGWIPEAWEENQLNISGVCDVIGGFAFKSSLMSSDQKKYQLVKMSNLYQGELNLNRNPSFIDRIDSCHEKYVLSEGDILITLTGTIGKRDYGYTVRIAKEENLLLNQRVCLLRPILKKIDDSFFYQFMKTKAFLNSFFESSIGGTGNQTNVSIMTLKDMRLFLPPLEEQEAIAGVLECWDAGIRSLEKKIELKRNIKKGLMQKLLSGQSRLSGFSGVWETVKFDSVFSFVKSYSFSRSDLIYVSKKSTLVYNIHYGDIHSTFVGLLLDFDKTKDVPLIKTDKSDGVEFSLLQEGDLVIADVSEDYAGICDCMELKNIGNRKVTAGLHTFAVRDLCGKTANGFRTYLLKHEVVSKRLKQIATGTSVHGVSKGNLQKLSLFVPPIDEQKAIAEVLSDADMEIETLDAKLARWKDQKKFLLNELVTGSIRVGAA